VIVSAGKPQPGSLTTNEPQTGELNMLTIARTAEKLNPKPERETVSYRLNYGGGKTEILTLPANPRERVEPVPVVDSVPDYPETGCSFHVTNAPEAYDGFGTKTVRRCIGTDRNGKPWRMIQVRDEHTNWQYGRNASGLNVTMEPADFYANQDLYAPGFVATEKPKPAPVVFVHVGNTDTTAKRQQDENQVTELVDQARAKRLAEEKQLAAFRAFDWTTKPSTWKPEFVLYYLETVCDLNVSHEDRTGTDFVNAQNMARAEDQFRRLNTITATANVNRRVLLDSLKTAKKFGGSRGVNKTVSLSVNGSLELVAINPDARFSQTVAFREKTGHASLTVPESRLLEIVNKLKADSIDFVLSCLPAFGEYVLTIKTDSATFTIPVEQSDDCDAFTSEFPAEYAHDVTAEELLNAFRVTEFATDTESTRYALGGLFIVPGSDSLEIVATDSRRLAWKEIPAEVRGTLPATERGETFHKLGLTIPAGIVSILSDELKRKPAAVVSFARAVVITRRDELKPPEQSATKSRTKTKPAEWKPEPATETNQRNVLDSDGRWFRETFRTEFVFELPGVFSIRGVPVDGRFPRYMDVIPRNFSHLFDFDRAELLSACETIILSTDEESRGVDFEFPAETETAQGSALRLLASSSNHGKATVTTVCKNACTSAEKPTIVVLDPKYVMDYLKRSTADSVRFSIVDPDCAILLTAEPELYATHEKAGCVIMPLSPDR
jgi:DNA polymerase III sliding clamp (beta) subunit (PCNA family)